MLVFVVFVVVVGFVFIVDDTKKNQIYLIIDAEKKKSLARMKPADEGGIIINNEARNQGSPKQERVTLTFLPCKPRLI